MKKSGIKKEWALERSGVREQNISRSKRSGIKNGARSRKEQKVENAQTKK